MRLVFVASATVALLAVSVAGSAVRPSPAALIAKGIARADLTPSEKAEYAVVLARARAELGRLPRARADLLRKVVADVAAQWRSYTSPRARALFSTLGFNERWLAGHAIEGGHPDLTGDDGVVYRFFWSHGYVFHPLANFAKLNELASRGRRRRRCPACAGTARAGDPARRRARLGVRVPVRVRPGAVDVRHGAGRRRPGARPRRRRGQRPGAARRRRRRLRRGARAALVGLACQALGGSLQLRPCSGFERAAPGRAFPGRLRRAHRRPRCAGLRRSPDHVRADPAAALRHRLLVTLFAPW